MSGATHSSPFRKNGSRDKIAMAGGGIIHKIMELPLSSGRPDRHIIHVTDAGQLMWARIVGDGSRSLEGFVSQDWVDGATS